MTTITAAGKFLLFALWCILMAPMQALFLCFNRGPAAYVLPHIWQRGVCRIFGLRVVVDGTPEQTRQVMFVCNHLSYLDIPVIASVLKASFIAKKDVRRWPVFGFLSTLQQTAFISRSRTDAKNEKNSLASMVAEGKSLILFPEGTSTDGRDVVPFKSSMFSLSFDTPGPDGNLLPIQPMTIIIDRVDGIEPNTAPGLPRDLYAWHGDMTMGPHLWDFAKSRGATIRLRFHPVIVPGDYADRKVLADACYRTVRGGLPVRTDMTEPDAPIAGLAARAVSG